MKNQNSLKMQFVKIAEINRAILLMKIDSTENLFAKAALEDLLERVDCFWADLKNLNRNERKLHLNNVKTWLEVAEDELQYALNLNKAFIAIGEGQFVQGPYSGNRKGYAMALRKVYSELRA